jgi:iron complex transport system substrate-binding protein
MPRFLRARRPRSRSRASGAGFVAGAVLTVGTLVASCSSTSSIKASSTADYPVTLGNCGAGTVTFDHAPTRILSTAPNLTEDLLALGLKADIIGDFGGNLPVSSYVAQYHAVRTLPTTAFTPEQLAGLRPDFVFAGWGYGFTTGTLLTPQGLAKEGIKSLVLTGSCPNADSRKAKSTTGPSNDISSTYQDLHNLGQIFNIRQRADEVITQMQAEVASVQTKVATLKPIPVMLYNNGQSAPGTAAGLSTPNGLITLAGGSNIFASLQQDYTTVSWEQVIAADPQCIIIKNGTDAGNFGEQEEQFLKSSAITDHLTAVRNDCFLILNQDQLTPGAANADAVVAIAHWLHPTAFGLPPDRS